MAEAFYDADHPLFEYFKANEQATGRTIPGGLELVEDLNDEDRARNKSVQSLVSLLADGTRSWFSSEPLGTNRSFAERFKYTVISSALLASSVSSVPLDTREPVPIREPAVQTRSLSKPIHPSGGCVSWTLSSFRRTHIVPIPDMQWMLPLIAASSMASQRLTVVLSATTWIVKMIHNAEGPLTRPIDPFESTVTSLNKLISASDAWDFAIGKCLSVLDSEKDTHTSSPSSQLLRATFLSACEATQTRSDNIRQLFSPLTSSLELSMLSEMYSPTARASISPKLSLHIRGFSMTGIPSSSTSTPQSKRSTWNGPGRIRHLVGREDVDSRGRPHSPPTPSVASFGSEPNDLDREALEDSFGSVALNITMKRRRLARRDLATPMNRSQSPLAHYAPIPTPFSWNDSLRTPPSPTHRHQGSNATTGSPSCKSSPRRGIRILSCSTLRAALDRAVLSRRYAASHLLALRFEEDAADNDYWQDASTLMALLGDALRDAASSLNEALDEYAMTKMQEQIPTPPSLVTKLQTQSPHDDATERDEDEEPHSSTAIEPLRGLFTASPALSWASGSAHTPSRPLPSVELSSFAPMPSDLSQFATHMDGMVQAIEKAQCELRTCLSALQSPRTSPNATSRTDRERSDIGDKSHPESDAVEAKVSALTQSVLDSYGRLRKELGVALKECERGKMPLSKALHVDEASQEIESETNPELDDFQYSRPPTSASTILPSVPESPVADALESGIDTGPAQQLDLDVFDDFIQSQQEEETTRPSRKSSLISSTSSSKISGASPNTPSPSQIPVRVRRNPFTNPDPIAVYEALPSQETITLRERSKISRAERIRQMREKRAKGGLSVLSDIAGSSADERPSYPRGSGRENRGPPPDVVQELKSLIHLVGEKRRNGDPAPTPTSSSAPNWTSFSALRRHQSAPSPPPIGTLNRTPTPSNVGEPSTETASGPPPIPPRVRPVSNQAQTTLRATRPPPPPPVAIPQSSAAALSTSIPHNTEAGFDTDTFGPPRDSMSTVSSDPLSSSPQSSPVASTFISPPSTLTPLSIKTFGSSATLMTNPRSPSAPPTPSNLAKRRSLTRTMSMQSMSGENGGLRAAYQAQAQAAQAILARQQSSTSLSNQGIAGPNGLTSGSASVRSVSPAASFVSLPPSPMPSLSPAPQPPVAQASSSSPKVAARSLSPHAHLSAPCLSSFAGTAATLPHPSRPSRPIRQLPSLPPVSTMSNSRPRQPSVRSHSLPQSVSIG